MLRPSQPGFRSIWLTKREIASGSHRELLSEPVVLEEHLTEVLELATIGVQQLLERLAQVRRLAHVDACYRTSVPATPTNSKRRRVEQGIHPNRLLQAA
jgi:hypothetical protein